MVPPWFFQFYPFTLYLPFLIMLTSGWLISIFSAITLWVSPSSSSSLTSRTSSSERLPLLWFSPHFLNDTPMRLHSRLTVESVHPNSFAACFRVSLLANCFSFSRLLSSHLNLFMLVLYPFFTVAMVAIIPATMM